MSSSLSDDAIRNIFVELQAKYVASQQQVNTAKAQIQAKQRERKLAELTRRELDTLDPDTKTYQPVGKMFLQAPLSGMKTEYAKKVTTVDDQIQQLEKSQKYWERAASDAQGNLKDILNGPRNM
ncbi:Prefoldin [Hesseltinella vesiculosa]|uniref:Prefoldin n=1 Tax=Hesseltinella vesiculosa TaxID=101127 RepID=A0A1X2G7R1_9FUNG|nr:Prefoldin [Hesseltinella vesiculosa]